MNNLEKQRVLELQELEQIAGGRFEVQDWSTASEGCGGLDDDEWPIRLTLIINQPTNQSVVRYYCKLS